MSGNFKTPTSKECTKCGSILSESTYNEINNTCFKERILLPFDITKNNINLLVESNSFTVLAKVEHSDDNNFVYNETSYKRTFSKKIKEAKLENEGDIIYVKGTFE